MQESGLRERQRIQTLLDLHHAASAIAIEQGLAAATIDAITSQADVSRRTFFNYYATKEVAVLGTVAPSVPPEALARFHDDSH
jgi:AcrR family transcriptional regulator